MKEYPMAFSAPMVKALLEDRKTQTRRLRFKGKPGDLIWVKETWAHWIDSNQSDDILYRADGDGVWSGNVFILGSKEYHFRKPEHNFWTPSIFMPCWTSRITLEVVEVREQRLWDITCEECRAEGVTLSDAAEYAFSPENIEPWRIAFREIWNSINSKRASWESNPVVNAITFKRIK